LIDDQEICYVLAAVPASSSTAYFPSTLYILCCLLHSTAYILLCT